MADNDRPKKSDVKPSEEEEVEPISGATCAHDCHCDVESDGSDHGDHDCDDDCCDHPVEMYIHESDPSDPVTKMCKDINKDLEAWETSGTMTKDKLNEALDKFDAALKMTAKHMEALLGKAYVLGELGQSELAVETLLKAMEIDAKDMRVNTMLMEMGEFQDSDGMPDLEVVERFMDQKGNPTPKFKAALVEVFERYAVGEGANRAITKPAMDKFHHFVNGGPLSSEAMEYLFSGEWDLNTQGNITLEGFISFYLNQTFADPQETINDLRKLGYDQDLNSTSTASPSAKSDSSPVPTV